MSLSKQILNEIFYEKEKRRVSDDWEKTKYVKFLGERILVIWDGEKLSEKQVNQIVKKMETYWPKIQTYIETFYEKLPKKIRRKLDNEPMSKENFIKRMIPNHILMHSTHFNNLVLGDFVIRQMFNCDFHVSFYKDGRLISPKIDITGNC